MRTLDWIALTLVAIGALNWGLVGFFNYDLISAIFGTASFAARTIFALVGIAGLYCLSFYGRISSSQNDVMRD